MKKFPVSSAESVELSAGSLVRVCLVSGREISISSPVSSVTAGREEVSASIKASGLEQSSIREREIGKLSG